MNKLYSTIVAIVLIVFVFPVSTAWANTADWEAVKNRSLDWIYNTVTPNPLVGSVGGEWAILAMARAERITEDSPWVIAWLEDLERTLTEIDNILEANPNIDISDPPTVGTFPSSMRRWTDFQRVTIALSSLGIDASNFNERDLTQIFSEFVSSTARHSLNQTINVDIFALIALDTMNYSGDRNGFLNNIINSQRIDGTWSLNPALPSSPFDLDITAMALQALAPYYNQGDAAAIDAVNRALRWLQTQTFYDPEGISQLIVALTALGEEYTDQAEYYVNQLLMWFDAGVGAFRRPTQTSPINLMATEQAAYALVAYWRFLNGKSALYDMGDTVSNAVAFVSPVANAVTQPDANQNETLGLPNMHADITVSQILYINRTFYDVEDHMNRLAIEALAERGIIGGRTSEEFAPNETMTRAEFAAVITRGLGLPAREVTLFDDVSSDEWFFEAVGTAFYYDIVSGLEANLFGPNGIISRQEAAVMVTRAAELLGINTSISNVEIINILALFGDYRTAAEWAWEALAFNYREGILSDQEFYINPTAPILRGEIADMLYQLLLMGNLL